MGITDPTTKIASPLGDAVGVYVAEDGKGAINVHDADVHTTLINRHFMDFDSATESPTVAIASGDYTILVASTTGFTVGDHVVIREADTSIREHHFDITAITVDTSITLNRPIDNAYAVTAVIERVIANMNVVGTLASPKIYTVKPPSDEVWHIVRFMINSTNDTAMTDENFCGITALTNGMVIRENRATIKTIAQWKKGGEMAEDMFNVDYPDKVPAGTFALRGRWTLKAAGTIARLDGAEGDYLEILVQDDLSAITSFRIKAQGHLE